MGITFLAQLAESTVIIYILFFLESIWTTCVEFSWSTELCNKRSTMYDCFNDGIAAQCTASFLRSIVLPEFRY